MQGICGVLTYGDFRIAALPHVGVIGIGCGFVCKRHFTQRGAHIGHVLCARLGIIN